MRAIWVVILASSACYSYRPLAEPAPSAGREVRATLTIPTSVRVGELTLHNVDRVDGLVFSATGDSLLISGLWVHTLLGSRYAAHGGVFPFERPALRSLEVRRFSPARTGAAALVTTIVGAALFAIVDRVLGGAGPGAPPGEGN